MHGSKLTFKPLARKRYRCNQTGQVMTQSQILAYVAAYEGGRGAALRIAAGPRGTLQKASKTASNHPSKYRSKHR